MGRMISIKDIAAKVGVHYSTVSLALRNSPKIPKATRQRILEAAEQLGYVPDPLLKALSAYRRQTRPIKYQGGIALIADTFAADQKKEEGNTWQPAYSRISSQFLIDCRTYAERLGFSLHLFSLESLKPSLAQVPKVLQARGIGCVILAPVRNPRDTWNLDLKSFSVVAMGYTVGDAPYHHVSQNQFANTRLHIHELKKRGFKRIGMHLNSHSDMRTRGRNRAAYLLEAQQDPRGLIPEILDEAHYSPQQWRSWIKRERPDALICLEYTMDELQQAGIRVPETLACSSMSLLDSSRMAGIDERSSQVIKETIERVVALWQNGEHGQPACATHLLVDGIFCDGPSLPPIVQPL